MVGPEQAEMLAVPQINESGDTIAWYAPFDGSIVPWTAATEEERAPARSTLQAARQSFLDRAAQLKENGTSSQDAEMFARMLPLAMHIPDESHIYLVDGRPVISFWGFDPLDPPPGVDVIRDLRPPEIVAAPPEVPRPAPPPPPPPVAPVVAAAEVSRPWWRWLLWLLPFLLLLLLLLFFLFGLKGCEVMVPTLGFDDRTPAVETPQLQRPDLSVDPGQVRPDLPSVGGLDGRLAGPDGGTVYQGNGVPTDVAPADGITPDQTMPPDATAPEVTPPDLTPPDATAPDATPEAPVPPDLTVPDSSALPPPDASAQEAPRGEDLVIPEQALQDGNTDFLNGRWRSHSGLVDRKNNTPLKVEFALKDGKGAIRIYRNDGTVCEGPMSATAQGGKLVFDQTSIATCPDGDTYNKIRVVCTPGSDGKAVCQGVNTEDGTTFRVGITR
jgi:hypothetical protein